MHGFSAHFPNAHAWIMFRKSFAFTCPQNLAFYAHHNPKRTLFCVSKAWVERALRSQRVKSGFPIRKGSESCSETAFRERFVPSWTGPLSVCAPGQASVWTNTLLSIFFCCFQIKWLNSHFRFISNAKFKWEIFFSKVNGQITSCKTSLLLWYLNNPHWSIYRQLRARRALLQFKDVLLRTRRVLSLYKVYSNSALLHVVLNGTSFAITPFWISTDGTWI